MKATRASIKDFIGKVYHSPDNPNFNKPRIYGLIDCLKLHEPIDVATTNNKIKKATFMVKNNKNQLKQLNNIKNVLDKEMKTGKTIEQIDKQIYSTISTKLKNVELVDTSNNKYKVTSIIKTKMFGGQAEKKYIPTDYEISIVESCKNNDPTKPELKDISDKITNQLPKYLPKNKAIHLGKAVDTKHCNALWLANTNRPDRTFKTDIKIGKYNITLKVTDGNDVVIGSPKIIRGEGQAIVFNAMNEAKVNNTTRKEIEDWFKPNNKGLYKIGTNEGALSLGTKYFVGNHKKFEAFLDKLCEKYPKFKKSIVKEMLTGTKKFEDGNRAAIATHSLIVSKDGNRVSFNEINDEYIDKILPNVWITVNWKSHGNSHAALRTHYNI